MDQKKHLLGERPPREDYIKVIPFFRKEGLLTKKLNDIELANLLEILTGPALVRYRSLAKDIGSLTIEMRASDESSIQKIALQGKSNGHLVRKSTKILS